MVEELKASSEATIKELEGLQNEKRKSLCIRCKTVFTETLIFAGKMLMEHETMKLKDQEEGYNRELREWKAQLKPRKQVSIYNFS
jgi:STE20-like kinase